MKNVQKGSKARDISSKNVLGNSVLCAQFLRDNVKVPIFKNVKSEDIEDVSERYRPYLGTEFATDTVKKIWLRDYSNEELLERGNEMSLIMLFNKIKDAVDLSELLKLPEEKLNRIIKDTPEAILDVIVSVMESLCIKIGASVEETKECVQKVRERKMGYMFENMEKMDIQAERRKTALAEQKAEKEKENSIKAFIDVCKELGADKETTKSKLIEKHMLDEKTAEEKVEIYWESNGEHSEESKN